MMASLVLGPFWLCPWFDPDRSLTDGGQYTHLGFLNPTWFRQKKAGFHLKNGIGWPN